MFKNIPSFKKGAAIMLASTISTSALLVAGFAYASEDKKEELNPQNHSHNPEVVIVFGRAERRIETAVSASEGRVSGSELRARPILRPGEILEAVPGLIATQHSGGGKANQYFLRGFNLDHGTDFATTIDDFPVNFLTHGHGQGYLDVNGLIPESVGYVEYRKGPYRADAGDFNFTGRAAITTLDILDPFVTAEYGTYDYNRIVGGSSFKIGDGDLLVLGQYKHQDGPWTVPEDFNGFSGLIKYTHPTSFGKFKIAINTYDASWYPTDQIPSRAVGTILTSPYDSLDKNLFGRTSRQVLTGGLYGADWKVTAWLQHYNWHLLSNFTFYLDNPVDGDEIRQFESLNAIGGRAEKTFTINDRLTLTTGLEGRYDDISDIGLDHAINGIVDYNKARFAVKEGSLGIYSEANLKITDKLEMLLGLRGDFYSFESHGKEGNSWSNKIDDQIVSPKFGLKYRLNQQIALYANWGEGFHSNDARGVTNPTDPAPGLVKGHMQEIGARYERRGLILTADIWQSEIDSELVYAADAGEVVPTNGGKRHGVEVTGFWRPKQWLAIDGVYATNDGKLKDVPAAEDGIPGAIKSSAEFGVTTMFDHYNFGARVRYLGKRNLSEDKSVFGKSSTMVNFRASYATHSKMEFVLELLNAFDSKGHDIDYYYTTRLQGEPTDGVDDIVYHISEPRQLRFGIKYKF
ncbi:TonB-dependent receptor [Pseudaquidulcibacter saccharophilus]|uniref:TonB-dependent receptor n=1 Tax=Pseudaquidulcibacter saccharophilus TaxID=2831900 RepID=UPI001EFEF4AC|nr:TonB-dependent receptor [Pseudaquidulcibacter saccharophilus]